MKNFYIENERIKLGISFEGGALVSFYDKKRGEEMLWQADERYWPSHDVVVFPQMGTRKNGFVVDGVEYNIPTVHGIARTQEFCVVDSSADFVHMEIKANEETLKLYPFNYKFGLKYQLLESGYKITYVVESLDGKEIPFYVGGHVAFNVPKGDLKILFEGTCDFYHYPELQTAPSADKSVKLFENTNEIAIDRNWYENPENQFKCPNGLMLERNFKGGCTMVRSDGLKFKYDLGTSTMVTLWGYKVGGDFFCVEPWWGMKQTESMESDLFKLPNINVVSTQPKEFSFAVEVFE